MSRAREIAEWWVGEHLIEDRLGREGELERRIQAAEEAARAEEREVCIDIVEDIEETGCKRGCPCEGAHYAGALAHMKAARAAIRKRGEG